MNPAHDEDGWHEYRRHVLASIEVVSEKVDGVESRLIARLDCLEVKLDKARLEVVELRTRATVWGGVAGAVVGALLSAVVAALVARGGGGP